MAVTPESETEQASTQPHRVDPSQPVLAAPKTYQRGINDGLRSWLKCQAIRNRSASHPRQNAFFTPLRIEVNIAATRAATPAGVVFVFIEPWPARLAVCLNRAR